MEPCPECLEGGAGRRRGYETDVVDPVRRLPLGGTRSPWEADSEGGEEQGGAPHQGRAAAKPRTALSIGLDVVKEPMFLMLIASGMIYLLLGDVQEALILLSFVFVIIGITFYQERKTERALEALRDLSSPRALVIRGAQQKRHLPNLG